MSDFEEEFVEFVGLLEGRLDKGREEYGDESHDLPPRVLLDEIEEELLDVCGWSYILFVRVRRMKEGLE